MAWFVFVEEDGVESEESQPFPSLADATLYAIDLAETLSEIAPFVAGRTVSIIREGGSLELSFAVLPSGLIGEDD